MKISGFAPLALALATVAQANEIDDIESKERANVNYSPYFVQSGCPYGVPNPLQLLTKV